MHWISGAASGTLSGVPIDDAVLTAALAETGVDHGPGLFGLVTEHGEVVFEGSVGVADLAGPRPIAAQDRFRIASVTKTYVAALVMQLIAEGRLSLDDSVQQRLPGARQFRDHRRVAAADAVRVARGPPRGAASSSTKTAWTPTINYPPARRS